MPKPEKLAAGVIVFTLEQPGDILLLRKLPTDNYPKGKFDFPKGGVEGDPEEGTGDYTFPNYLLNAAYRECQEETKIAEGRTFEIVPDVFIDIIKDRSFLRLYLGVYDFTRIHVDGEEHDRYYWVDKWEAMEAFEDDGNRQFADAVEEMFYIMKEDPDFKDLILQEIEAPLTDLF